MLKAVPEILACESVTLPLPVFVIVSEIVEFLPTCTLPNDSVVGFALTVPLAGDGVVLLVPL
jgi:hypothetical protein